MRWVAVLLACFACMGQSRRLKVTSELPDDISNDDHQRSQKSSKPHEVTHPTEVLTKLLVGYNPSASWQGLGAGPLARKVSRPGLNSRALARSASSYVVDALRLASQTQMLDPFQAILDEAGGDEDEAVEKILAKPLLKAEKTLNRETFELGLIRQYTYHDTKTAVIIEINSENATKNYTGMEADYTDLATNLCKIIIASPQIERPGLEDFAEDEINETKDAVRNSEDLEGKSEEAKESIVKERVRETLMSRTLLYTTYTPDPSMTVSEYLKSFQAKAGGEISIFFFVRMDLTDDGSEERFIEEEERKVEELTPEDFDLVEEAPEEEAKAAKETPDQEAARKGEPKMIAEAAEELAEEALDGAAKPAEEAVKPAEEAVEVAKEEGVVDLEAWLNERVKLALVEAFGPEQADAKPMVTAATNPDFGDYQCNAAMALGKKLKSKPRDVATKLVEVLQVDDVFELPEIAGPGFINLRLKKNFLQQQLQLMLQNSERCGVAKATPTKRVVVDYSSPNIAKEMHVGHLRSTIIGDCLSRILEFRGHDVLRLNHVGDWGTQFGMLILHLADQAPKALAGEEELEISDLVSFYREAKVRFDEDESFKTQAREEVVKLQAGNERSLAAWQMLCKQSEVAFQKVYDVLSVDPRLEVRGESFYNPQLPGVIDMLRSVDMLEESEGCQCVFLDGYVNRDGDPQPMIVQKSDGGFLYSTTDIAAVKHRVEQEKADRVLYVTDSGQGEHFEQVYKIAKLSGIAPAEKVSLEHVPFGLVLGEDGKKFKTRSGDTVKLMDLLDEAISRTGADFRSRLEADGRPEATDDAYVDDVAKKVGIGAVKYADLSMNRKSNYKFSFDKMLSLQGNTAPYMMYAYARIRGIQRKITEKLADDGAAANTDFDFSGLAAESIILEAEEELNLAKELLKFAGVVIEVEAELLPSALCLYIFELTSKFNRFYEGCPVWNAGSDELRTSRLALCELTAQVIKLSLGLLGLEPLEKL